MSVQPSFDDLGQPLSEVTFVVVDLETTGARADDTITEIGAVKVRGGEVLGEFQTLVNPHRHIPPLVAVLTGITNATVADAPSLPQVLPSFLSFLSDGVLVAHNARFDVGFLTRACAELGYRWPGPMVHDTVALARSILHRDEVPNYKLSTLARYFRTNVSPDHRALSDARATVEVLHGLLERVGNLGVHTVEDLHGLHRRVSPQRRAKRTWADTLPERPGVYWFEGSAPEREVLYVGTSKRLRTRVRTYFTAAEKRRRMEEMIRVAEGVRHVECVTDLEARVRELRMIDAHRPRYNRRSKFPERTRWLKVTVEPFPRLSVVRTVARDHATYLGPLGREAEDICAALYEAFPVRRCTPRLSRTPQQSGCALAEMSRCVAPCTGGVSIDDYGALIERLRDALHHDVRPVLHAHRERIDRLITQERFEEAGEVHRRLVHYCSSVTRFHRLHSIARCAEVVAARRVEDGWEIHVLRYGRLANAALARVGDDPMQVALAARASAEVVAAPNGPEPSALVEETRLIAEWLESDGVRIIEIDGEWTWPRTAVVLPDELPALLTTRVGS
ncbi:DEDD exonuclease domain-containing protein [Enemella sp. A6]|uniref:DEDD exonuclease domain-containing protein n=1 Tax=Enemella sp. A6 TaxID=3440152 RepID=UPI003EBA598D